MEDCTEGAGVPGAAALAPAGRGSSAFVPNVGGAGFMVFYDLWAFWDEAPFEGRLGGRLQGQEGREVASLYCGLRDLEVETPLVGRWRTALRRFR